MSDPVDVDPARLESRSPGWRHAPLLLGALLSILAVVQAHHRADQGRGALLRWESDFEAFWSGAQLYALGSEEGYPTLPVTLVLMQPFRALGPIAGSLAWAVFKIGLAWWLVTRALALAAGHPRGLPVWAQLCVVLLSFRPLLSDVLHGNINLIVGATVASAAWSWSRGRSLAAGVWLGLGAALKVTPALGLLFLVYKRSARGCLGVALGLAAGALAPALFVGLERTLALDVAWWQQMVRPYLEGRELTLMQTQHINQSLFGVLARHLTDAVAVEAAPPKFPEALRIGWLALSPGVFRGVHMAVCAGVLAFVLACLASDTEPRAGQTALGEFSLLALAMLVLSERSWKHHHVLLAFPIAYLVAALVRPRDRRGARVALAGLAASAVLHGASGSAFLGSSGSDLAEALGAYLAGTLVLLLSVGLCLRRARRSAAVDAKPKTVTRGADAPR